MYFWQTQCGQFVKIGCCQSSLYKRRVALNNGCPQGICDYPIGVIICEDKADMLKVERASQKQFKACRANGEWFELTDEISEYIQEFTDTESSKRFVEEDRERERERGREIDRERHRKRYPERREYYREYYRERYQNNPEIRERKNKSERENRARKKREHQQISGQQLMLPGVDDNE